jgi:DNA-binding SARP family transcriptional activator
MHVSLLGSPLLLIDLRPVETLRRKNRALVYYLAAHGEPLTRDQVLALFWPDTPRPAAQQILRSMLYDLRRSLPPGALSVEEDRLALAADIQVDAQRFRQILRSASPSLDDLASALALYRGDFLDGFTLVDNPAFDDWANVERENYRSLAIHGWTTLSRRYEEDLRLQEALNALTHAIALDPLQEELQRTCLRLQVQLGDRAGAIRRYEALCKLLDAELGMPPMPETRALYDAIVTDQLPRLEGKTAKTPEREFASLPSTPAAPLFTFTGRDNELRTLHTQSSSGKMILVEGVPGMGKTRLVDEFLRTWQSSARPPVLVLCGAAHELEQGLPYQPIADALRGLLSIPDWPSVAANLGLAPVWQAEITRLLPDLNRQIPGETGSPPLADEARLWEACLQFLKCLARTRPVVLLLDDLHWADSASIGLVGYLARRALSGSLLLIATARLEGPRSSLSALVQALVREEHLVRVSLAPLSPGDTVALARQISPADYPTLSDWLIQNAEGNAFFLTELVRHAYQAQILNPHGQLDTDRLESTSLLSPTIQNIVLSRLIRVSEEARRVLDIAAVIGRDFDFDLVYQTRLAAAGATTETGVLDALGELQTAHLIQARGGDTFSFDHSLTMEVVLQDMGEARARLLHRQVGGALAQMHRGQVQSAAGRIANHFSQGNAPERAAPYAFIAGQAAARLAAWEEAIGFFEQALASEGDPGRRAELLTALGNAQFHRGAFIQATDAFRAAIEIAREHADLVHLEAAHLALNESFLPQSRFAEAVALARELAESGPPELALCAHFTWAAALAVESAHPNEAELHLRAAQKWIDEQPNYHGPITPTLIKYQLASVLGQQGQNAQAAALYREAIADLHKDDQALDLLRHIMAYNDLAYQLFLLGDPSANDYVQAGIKLAQERGSLSHMANLLSTSGEIALGQNRLDQAEQSFSDGLKLAVEVPIPERIAGLTANLGLVARQRGQDELARERLGEALARADQLGNGHLAVRIRCWLIPLLPPDEARRRLQEARAIAEQGGFGALIEEITALEDQIPER